VCVHRNALTLTKGLSYKDGTYLKIYASFNPATFVWNSLPFNGLQRRNYFAECLLEVILLIGLYLPQYACVYKK
jgi:hypothetical protein